MKTDCGFVALPKDQVEALLDTKLFQLGSLRHNPLKLLTGHVGLFQKKPAWNFIWNLDAVLFNLPQFLIMVGDEAKKSFAWLSRQLWKVSIKILWPADTGSILKSFVQSLHQIIKRWITIDLGQIVVFNQAPCCSLKWTDDIQNAFCRPFLKLHLQMVNVDTFPPFLIRLGLPIKQCNERIVGNHQSHNPKPWSLQLETQQL